MDSISLIMDVQNVIRNLMEFRLENRENKFLERQIKEIAHLQSSLVERYQKRFGEFPFEIVELVQ